MRRILLSPITYAALYLALIPTFAVLYQRRADQFFHSAIRLEEGYATEKESAMRRLRQAIAVNYTRRAGTSTVRNLVEVGGYPARAWEASTRWIEVANLDVNGTSDSTLARVSFTVFVPTFNDKLGEFSTATFRVSFDLLSEGPDSFGVAPREPEQKLISKALVVKTPPRRKILRIIDPRPLRAADLFPPEVGAIDLSLQIGRPLQRDLIELWQSRQGIASGLPGEFARYLYLSGVTITTLGYGDIVPLTEAARLLVALEAVLGIVVIGAFLGTLYRGRHADSQANVNEPDD